MSKILLQALHIGRFRISLRCTSPVRFDGFIGAELRGAFGAGLHGIHCLGHGAGQDAPGRCSECPCLYGSLFEPRSGSLAIVRPFVIEPLQPTKLKYEAGEELQFDLLLIGRAINALPQCLAIWETLGRRGIGWRYRYGWGRFDLVGIAAGFAGAGATPSYSAIVTTELGETSRQGATDFEPRIKLLAGQVAHDGHLGIQFLTPMEIRKRGAPLRDLEFSHIWDSLATRLQNLVFHFCQEASLPTNLQSEWREAKEMASEVRKVENAWHWQSQHRYSGSQQRRIEMGGLIGQATFAGDFTSLLPLLVVGEWLHIGKGCDMGNGQFRLG